jgi:OOP family OmpA-OmpF porin
MKSGDDAQEPPPPPPPPPPPAATTAEPAPAPAPTEPAATPTLRKSKAEVGKGGSVRIPGNIVFDTGKASLKEGAGSEAVLEELKLYMEENKEQVAKLRIEGHTDNVGKPADNLELSGQRALTIKKWLIDHEVAADRLLAVGFGEQKPLAPNTTDDGRAQNRRTEFKIAMVFGKDKKPTPYLGMDVTGGGKEFK